MKESWLEKRWQWQGEDGKPMAPDFSRSTAKRMENMEEPDYTPPGDKYKADHTVKLGGKELEQSVVEIDGFDEQELVTIEQMKDFEHPKVRRRREALEVETPEKVKKRLANKRKYWERLEREGEVDLRKLQDEGWEAYLKAELAITGNQRMQLLHSLTAKYTGKKARRRLGKGKKVKGKAVKLGKYAKAAATKAKVKKKEAEKEAPELEGALWKKMVYVFQEAAGQELYRTRGEVLHHRDHKVQIRIEGCGFHVVVVAEEHVQVLEGDEVDKEPYPRVQMNQEEKLRWLLQFPAAGLEKEEINEEGRDCCSFHMQMYWKILLRELSAEKVAFLDPQISGQFGKCMGEGGGY